MNEELIPLSEAARELGLAQQTLRVQVANGRFLAWKLGPIWVTDRAEVERYRVTSRGHPGPKKGAHL